MQWSARPPVEGGTACANASDSGAASAALFGVVVPGYPVITDVQGVDGVRWTTSLGPAPESFVVFLTQPLPPGYGIGVYLARAEDMLFQYIGYLTQERPSSLFRVPAACLHAANDAPASLVLGLSLERLEDIANLGQTQQQPLQQAEAATRGAIAEHILQDLYNYLTSYARCVGPAQTIQTPSEGEYIVMPASFVDRWRERVQRRIAKDVSFLHGA